MDAIRYLDADTILDYLHNSSETYLEGLIPQSYGFPTETDRSVYVRLLKVPVRDKASEVYMQAIPYKMFEGDSNRPIEEFGKDTKFEKVGVIIDSSRLWLMEPLWRICTQSRQKFDDADFVSEFWDAFTRKVLKEYAVDARVEKSTNEGTIYYDVLFDIGMPGGKSPPSRVIVDIEAQNHFNPGYSMLKRGSFYCGRMISAQKETVFRNSDYNKLQKVYSIWLCIAPDEKVRGVCNTYSMSETCLAKEHHFPKKQYDNFCIIIACLQDKQSANNMVRFFSSVFDNDMPVEEKLDLARECGLQVTADVKEGINQMCNYSDYVEQKGIEKGRIETLSESVVKLVRSGTLTLDAALDVLQVSDDIRATVKENAEKALNQ